MLKKLFEQKKEEGTFVEDRMHSRMERRRTVIVLLFISALIGWLYIFFGSNTFTVTSVEIEGLDTLERGEVAMLVDEFLEDQRQWPFREKNLFFINANEIASGLKEALFLENVDVDKIYPNILRLKIEERQSTLFLLTGRSLYEIDRHGIVTKEFNKKEQEEILDRIDDPSISHQMDLPIIKIRESSETPVPGQEYVSEFRSTSWLDTFQVLHDLGFGYRNAVLDYTTSSKLVLNMFEPYEVYIDLLDPLEPQIASFYAFMKARDPNVPIYEYVDTRIPGKVFFK
jgi:hypothetical protein